MCDIVLGLLSAGVSTTLDVKRGAIIEELEAWIQVSQDIRAV